MADPNDNAYRPLVNTFLRIQVPSDLTTEEAELLFVKIEADPEQLEEKITQALREFLGEERASCDITW